MHRATRGLAAMLGVAVALAIPVTTPTEAAAAAAPTLRVAMVGSPAYPGTRVYTGSAASTSRYVIRPSLSAGPGIRFVRGSLVAQRRIGTRWVTVGRVTSTRASRLHVAVPAGRYRATYVAWYSYHGRLVRVPVRRVGYLSVFHGPVPRAPVVSVPRPPPDTVVPPPPVAPPPPVVVTVVLSPPSPPVLVDPSLVVAGSWHGPADGLYNTWFAARIGNPSPDLSLATSRDEVLFPVIGMSGGSSIYDTVPALPRASEGWFVTNCWFDCTAFALSGDLVIHPFWPHPSTIPDGAWPTTDADQLVVTTGPTTDVAAVTTHVTNPSGYYLTTDTAAHVVLLDPTGVPVYAFRATLPSSVAPGTSADMTLAPTGSTGFRWSPEQSASVATIEITLDPHLCVDVAATTGCLS